MSSVDFTTPVSGAGSVVGVVAGTVVVVEPPAVVVVDPPAVVDVVAWGAMTPFWAVLDVDPAVVVVVEPPAAAVVVVDAGAVVVVVVTATFSAGSACSTPRNRSSAVWPTIRSALSRSFTPGRSMMML